jgi:aminoglycoside 3-N-acetyltransferase
VCSTGWQFGNAGGDMIARFRKMIPNPLQPVVEPVYRRVRRQLNRVQRALDRRTLDENSLRNLLVQAGLKRAAVVMVHSSMDELARRVPGLTAISFINLLMELVGANGTILMPTFPFRGKQLHYVEQQKHFDVRKTPSQVGLITEVFRRMPGVSRSLHPTHPVAAWGKQAVALTSTHHLGGAFDTYSPFYRMAEHNGLVIGAGTSLRDSFTILHVPEELHAVARKRFFEEKVQTMTVFDGEEEFEYTFRVLRATAERDYDRVEAALLRDGTLRYLKSRGLSCAVTDANTFIQRSMQLIEEGRYL